MFPSPALPFSLSQIDPSCWFPLAVSQAKAQIRLKAPLLARGLTWFAAKQHSSSAYVKRYHFIPFPSLVVLSFVSQDATLQNADEEKDSPHTVADASLQIPLKQYVSILIMHT